MSTRAGHVAKYLLEFERGCGGASARLASSVGDLKLIAEQGTADWPEANSDDTVFGQELREVPVAPGLIPHAVSSSWLWTPVQGASNGPGTSMRKKSSYYLGQRLEELKVAAIGYYWSAKRKPYFLA